MKDTHINENSKYKGNLESSGNAIISGKIEGEVKVKNIVKIEKSAVVNGNITSKTIFINGIVNGNINAEKAVVLKDNGNVIGDIKTPSIIVEERSTHVGKVKLV